MKEVIERFIRYAKIDTQSDPNSNSIPTTKKQFDLANLLVKELQSMGLDNAYVNEYCYVYAVIPSNIPNDHPKYGKVPRIGFVAHVDTSPDAPASNVNPIVHENYAGGDISLGNSGVMIKYDENKALKDCIGHTIITSDGTTLLSSDDKSGVTAIMTLAEILSTGVDFLHGEVGICFTPDEEVGKGTIKFDLKEFGCKYAYTIDGEMPPYLNKETFSADHAWIRCYGREIHPGNAKGIMINSMRAMAGIIAKLPKDMAPETTEGHQPYIHPHHVEGTVGKSELMLLFRAFNDEDLAKQKKIIEEIIESVQKDYPDTQIDLEVKEIYRNMLNSLTENPEGCDYMFEAAKRAGLEPVWEPIRGGTDGSKLTEMGLPCPNIFTGGQNFHSLTEWLSFDSLMKSIETMKHLVGIWTEES